MKGSVLIIDDDPDILDALRILLEDEFSHVQTESNPNRLDFILAQRDFDVTLLDMNFSAGVNTGNEGLFWLSKILRAHPETSVILMTAYGNIGLAVDALKRGAKDFILKPWDNETLLANIRSVLKSGPKRTSESRTHHFVRSVSMCMEALHIQMLKVASTDASILLLGESGTGKSAIAREIHRLSSRTSKPFHIIDLSTLTPTLFESELFGHVKGAFSDARSDKQGRFEAAGGGTVFLDEIGNLPLPQQSKLLSVLQNKEVTPLGSNKPVAIDVRVIAATNADLESQSDQGLFRKDLLFRINTITLTIPPLRDRKDDIVYLADYFLDLYKAQYENPDLQFHSDTKQTLLAHSWPGNVRELQHIIEKAVILSTTSVITPDTLSLPKLSRWGGPVTKTLDQMEKEALQLALGNHGGNMVHTAKALGITRQTLYNKMKKYGL